MVSGDTSLFTYILFLIAASRLYDPLSGAMSNMAELFSVQLQVNRLKEIEEYPEETGEKNIHTNGYGRKTGSQILSSGRRKNTVGRNRYCSAKFNHVDEKLLYRFSRCCAV